MIKIPTCRYINIPFHISSFHAIFTHHSTLKKKKFAKQKFHGAALFNKMKMSQTDKSGRKQTVLCPINFLLRNVR